jgi:hapalindole H/12-epi-hapalindole U/12-epi-fischerindole U synthase
MPNRTPLAAHLCLALSACIAAGDAAFADPIPVVNPGFEANFAAPNSFPVLVPTGWTLDDQFNIIDQVLDAVGVLNPTGGTFYPAGAPEGNNVALIYLSGDAGAGPVALRQALTGHTYQAGSRYTLTVEVGNIASGFGAPPFNSFFDLDGFPGYQVQFLAGNVVVAQDNNTLAASIPEGEFRTSTVVFDVTPGNAAIGATVTVRLVNLNTPGTADAPGIEVNFDHVRVEAAPIPVACAGDANGDTAVNFADITSVLGSFGASYAPGTGPGDADRNGVVNFADITVVLGNFGAGC